MKLPQKIMNVRLWICCGVPFILFFILCLLCERKYVLGTTYFECVGIISAIMVGAIQNLRMKLAEYNVSFARNCPLSDASIKEHLDNQSRSSLQLTQLIILGLATTVVTIFGVVVEKTYPSFTWLVFYLSCSLSISCIANYLYMQFDYMRIESKNLNLVFEERLVERTKEVRNALIEKISKNKDDKFPEQWKI